MALLMEKADGKAQQDTPWSKKGRPKSKFPYSHRQLPEILPPGKISCDRGGASVRYELRSLGSHLTFIPPLTPCWLHVQNFIFGIFIFIFTAHHRERKNHTISSHKIPWYLLSSETKTSGWEINNTQSSTPSLLASLLLANHGLPSHQDSFNSLLQFMSPTAL